MPRFGGLLKLEFDAGILVDLLIYFVQIVAVVHHHVDGHAQPLAVNLGTGALDLRYLVHQGNHGRLEVGIVRADYFYREEVGVLYEAVEDCVLGWSG